MKAQDLKVGSKLEIQVPFSTENGCILKKVEVTINRVSDTYVWFKYSSFERVGRNTIDKYPSLYKIISL